MARFELLAFVAVLGVRTAQRPRNRAKTAEHILAGLVEHLLAVVANGRIFPVGRWRPEPSTRERLLCHVLSAGIQTPAKRRKLVAIGWRCICIDWSAAAIAMRYIAFHSGSGLVKDQENAASQTE